MSTRHYENFPVASWLCPASLRPAVRAIYAFSRTADDLADEGDAPVAQRLADLRDYRADLGRAAAGEAPSPRWADVFQPLGASIAAHALPVGLLADLLSAFEQDLVKTRYADRAELLDYCSRSANPVGRLLLHLYGVAGAAALRQSDAICSALQLVNFWQDLGVDTRRSRLYVPLADCTRHAVAPSSLMRQDDGPAIRALVRDLVQWTRTLMQAGAQLVHAIPGRAGWELRLVVQGGLAILDKIEALGFASLRARPTLRRLDAPRLAWRAFGMRPAHTPVAGEAA